MNWFVWIERGMVVELQSMLPVIFLQLALQVCLAISVKSPYGGFVVAVSV